jgi:hypothetical protein
VRKASASQQSTSVRTNNAASHSVTTQRFHPQSYNATPRTNSSAVVRQNNFRSNRVQAGRDRGFSNNNSIGSRNNVMVNRERNFNRERNITVNRDRNFNRTNNFNRDRNFTVNGDRNFNRTRNFNRDRNLTVNRERNFNRDRNVTINRERNIGLNRRNVTVTNNWRGERFGGQHYAAFRNYHREWHDRNWWSHHYSRIIFVSGGWYCWNAGYWYPAWGYAPGAYYPYDGPIYGYNDLTPDQVVVNVQAQLQADGYYDGPVDGVLGTMTRQAIADYQADHGLAVTASVDEPTLANLGLV